MNPVRKHMVSFTSLETFPERHRRNQLFFLICFCSKNQNNSSADIKNKKITEILNSKNTNFITNLKICSNINNTQYSQT